MDVRQTEQAANSGLPLDDYEERARRHLWRAQLGRRRCLDHFKEVGNILIEVKSKKLVKLDAWCSEKLGMRKSQRCEYMLLAKEWGSLRAAREWARGRGEQGNSQSFHDVVRLLRNWKRRDKPAVPRKSKTATPKTELDDDERKSACAAYAAWSDAKLDNQSLVDAELRLFRFAASVLSR